MGIGSESGSGSSSDDPSSSSGWSGVALGVVVKTLVLIGGALLLKRLTKSTTRWDHACHVTRSLSGEKFSKDQAARDPDHYFNIRMSSCPVAEMVDGSKVLYFEQAFWRSPQKPFRQRFYMVKPCPKELKCDVDVSSYAIRDAEEYKIFCDRSKDQRPLPEEVIRDIAEHLTTVHLKCCERGKRCLYEGSTPPASFPIHGMEHHTVLQNLQFLKTMRYILGIGDITTKEIKFGDQRKVLTSSSPHLPQVPMTCFLH